MRPNIPFDADDRAIEGLPIRLVIALVVGVASLGIMMNMLTDVDGLTQTELTVEYDDNVVDRTGSTDIAVVTEDGEPVEGASVIVSGGTVGVDDTYSEDAEDGDGNEVTGFEPDDDVDPQFGTNQDMGTLEIEIVPPTDGDYVDDRDNPVLRVAN